MKKKNFLVGLNWPTFFMLENGKMEEIDFRIRNFDDNQFDLDGLIGYIYPNYYREKLKLNTDVLANGILHVVLNWCLNQSDFAKYCLEEDELLKMPELLKRKQYASKTCKKLLAKFQFLAGSVGNVVAIMFSTYIPDLLKSAQEIEVSKRFKPLQQVITKIASGVNPKCYLEAVQVMSQENLSSELSQYVLNAYGFDFNEYRKREMENRFVYVRDAYYKNNLGMFLFEDGHFWKTAQQFDIICFLNSVEKENSSKHARKILDQIFANIKQNHCSIELLDKYKIIVYVDEARFVECFERVVYESNFINVGLLKYIEKYKKVCVFPIYDTEDCSLIENGKAVFQQQLKYFYPNGYNKVLKSLDALGVEFENDGKDYGDRSIAEIIEKYSFYMHQFHAEISILENLCPNYFNNENVMSRVYIACSILAKNFEGKMLNQAFYNVFNAFIEMVESRLGVVAIIKQDDVLRNAKYGELKTVLTNYDVEISDEYKKLYITALLDRKVATVQECDIFPQLEQHGDAIYNFAIAELIFYNPSKIFDVKSIDEYIKAITQVDVSRASKIDKLYIDSDINSFASTCGTGDVQEKYIADSLEMILAVVARDKGVCSAIELAKKMIINANLDLGEEVKETNTMKRYLMEEIDDEYWECIYPSEYDHSYYREHSIIDYTLSKLLQCEFLGTDTVEKRQKITYSFGLKDVFTQFASKAKMSPVLYDYFQQGLNFVLDEYRKLSILLG